MLREPRLGDIHRWAINASLRPLVLIHMGKERFIRFQARFCHSYPFYPRNRPLGVFTFNKHNFIFIYLFFPVLRVKPRASQMLDKCAAQVYYFKAEINDSSVGRVLA